MTAYQTHKQVLLQTRTCMCGEHSKDPSRTRAPAATVKHNSLWQSATVAHFGWPVPCKGELLSKRLVEAEDHLTPRKFSQSSQKVRSEVCDFRTCGVLRLAIVLARREPITLCTHEDWRLFRLLPTLVHMTQTECSAAHR